MTLARRLINHVYPIRISRSVVARGRAARRRDHKTSDFKGTKRSRREREIYRQGIVWSALCVEGLEQSVSLAREKITSDSSPSGKKSTRASLKIDQIQMGARARRRRQRERLAGSLAVMSNRHCRMVTSASRLIEDEKVSGKC